MTVHVRSRAVILLLRQLPEDLLACGPVTLSTCASELKPSAARATPQPLTQRDRSLLPGLRHSLRTAGTAPATASAAAAAGGRSRTGVERSRGDLNGPGAQGAGGWEGDETQPPSSCHGEQLTTPQAGGLDSGSDADDQAGDEEEGEEESGEEGAAAGGALRPWLQELQVMEATGYKADIESLYSVVGYGGLREAVVRAILRGDWL